MRDDQKRFLQQIAHWIPILFDEIAKGNACAEITLGVRTIADRRVRLLLRVAEIDPGRNPLATHGHQDIEKRAETVEVAAKSRGSRRVGRRARSGKPVG